MVISKRKFLLLAGSAGLSSGFGWQAHSGSQQATVATNNENVAIRGYDTVAYFTDGKPTPGSPDYEFLWSGARWRFASAAHRDLFAKRPEFLRSSLRRILCDGHGFWLDSQT